MIATSAGQTIRFTPPWLCREDKVTPLPGSPVFHLRAGSITERSLFEAELAAPPNNAGRVMDYDLRRALRDGVMAIFAGDPESDQVLDALGAEDDAIAAAIESADGKIEPLPEDQARILVEVRKIMQAVPGEYADLVARQARRNFLMPTLAFHRYCQAWENCGAPLARDLRGQIRDDLLRPIDEYTMIAAGLYAYGLQWVGDQAGNSSRPSTSNDGQTTSSSDAPPMAAGKSGRRAGKKTPA